MHRLAICTVVKNEGTYLAEWISYHWLQGVTLFRIYDTGSTDGTLELLSRIGKSIPIEIGTWPPAGSDGTQLCGFRDGTKCLSGRARFVAFIDPDEFLIAKDFQSLPKALKQFGDAAAVASCQRVFGSNGHEEHTEGLVISRFTRRAKQETMSHWTKIIARPERIKEWTSSHSVECDGMVLMTDGTARTATGPHPGCVDTPVDGQLWHNHYMLRSLAEFREHKQTRGSLSDTATNKRFSDSYFINIDHVANVVEDTMLASQAGRVAVLLWVIQRPAIGRIATFPKVIERTVRAWVWRYKSRKWRQRQN
ncbi:glycosyltransferase family 92 protein [Aminobacter sp. HY435]|uniref:glycosyltransferase family 92 protein n=1 Tax=Aminobacter sp. HY435 TaxID=2970917 RepID=UPI0022B995B8|nr:glycosyltransferase family 92 protein [Aminobacter sp. HY435]